AARRRGPPLAAAVLRAHRRGPGHRLGRCGARGRPARRDRRRDHHRARRGARPHRDRPPPEGQAPVSTLASRTEQANPMGTTTPAQPTGVEIVAGGRRSRGRRRRIVLCAMVLVVVILFATTLMVGRTLYSPAEVLGVI